MWQQGIVAVGGGNSDGGWLDGMAAVTAAMVPEKSTEKSGKMVAETAAETETAEQLEALIREAVARRASAASHVIIIVVVVTAMQSAATP